MNKRGVEIHLFRKMQEWISSVREKDEELADAIQKHAIVTGGCIVSLLTGEKINDYDVYFKTQDTATKVAEYYIARFREAGNNFPADVKVFCRDNSGVEIRIKSAGVAGEGDGGGYEYFETKADEATEEYVDRVFAWKEDIEARLARDGAEYRPIFFSTNAITLSGGIQLVLRFVGSPRKIHDNFDFVHCVCWYDIGKSKLYLRKDAIQSMLTKELIYVGSKYPVCSLMRMRKFIKRGWNISAGQIVKIALQISDLDLSLVEVLEDQLIGVDVAYFEEVLDRIKSKDAGSVERAYLIKVLDGVFDD